MGAEVVLEKPLTNWVLAEPSVSPTCGGGVVL